MGSHRFRPYTMGQTPGDKPLFGQRLGIQAAGLLFYRAEGTAHGNSCQFAFTAILRQVEIAN